MPPSPLVSSDSKLVVAAFDKFRHTATAQQLCGVIGDLAWERNLDCRQVPLADGGEGSLSVLAAAGGRLITSVVHGPLGFPCAAQWLLRDSTAYIEMALASGLALLGGKENNRALDATTRGTGDLMVEAMRLGAKRIVVCLGGSATTDGGLGALEAMAPLARFRGVEIVVACDVETTFVAAASDFGPQKGATESQVALLTRRLESLADRYLADRGVDVRSVVGGGAAGGLAGAFVSIGGRLQSGFSLIAEEVGFAESLSDPEPRCVVTGEGFLDVESFNGKVVGGVCDLVEQAGSQARVVIVCGGRQAGLVLPERIRKQVAEVFVLSERFGRDRSWADPLGCIRDLGDELFVES